MMFVIVEDDHLQAEALQKELARAFPGARVHHIATEKDFRSYLSQPTVQRPDLWIIDVMLRWTDPEPEMQSPPEDVLENGPARAGFRCLRLLARNPNPEAFQIILFTVLEREDLKANLGELPEGLRVSYMPKGSSFSRLIDEIKARLRSG